MLEVLGDDAENMYDPLSLALRVGDRVCLRCDVLVEVARHAPGLPPAWRFVPAGSTGKLLGWRGEARAIVDIDDMERRLVVFVSAAHVMRTRTPDPPTHHAG